MINNGMESGSRGWALTWRFAPESESASSVNIGQFHRLKGKCALLGD
jgi:hypothetical protein